jgi:hypothetical protein
VPEGFQNKTDGSGHRYLTKVANALHDYRMISASKHGCAMRSIGSGSYEEAARYCAPENTAIKTQTWPGCVAYVEMEETQYDPQGDNYFYSAGRGHLRVEGTSVKLHEAIAAVACLLWLAMKQREAGIAPTIKADAFARHVSGDK